MPSLRPALRRPALQPREASQLRLLFAFLFAALAGWGHLRQEARQTGLLGAAPAALAVPVAVLQWLALLQMDRPHPS